MKVKMKTVYVLKVKPDDDSPWSDPGYYRTRKERDETASMNRVLGGIRTYSYKEKKPVEEVEELLES